MRKYVQWPKSCPEDSSEKREQFFGRQASLQLGFESQRFHVATKKEASVPGEVFQAREYALQDVKSGRFLHDGGATVTVQHSQESSGLDEQESGIKPDVPRRGEQSLNVPPHRTDVQSNHRSPAQNNERTADLQGLHFQGGVHHMSLGAKPKDRLIHQQQQQEEVRKGQRRKREEFFSQQQSDNEEQHRGQPQEVWKQNHVRDHMLSSHPHPNLEVWGERATQEEILLPRPLPPRQASTLGDLLSIRAFHSLSLFRRRHHLQQLQSALAIQGTALGLRVQDGKLTNQPSILVFVARKVHDTWLQEAQHLPRKLLGPDGCLWCDVDVIEFSCHGSTSTEPRRAEEVVHHIKKTEPSSKGGESAEVAVVAAAAAAAAGADGDSIEDGPGCQQQQLVERLCGGDQTIGPGSQLSSAHTFGSLCAIVRARSPPHQLGLLTSQRVAVDCDSPNQRLYHPFPPDLGPGICLGTVEKSASIVSDHHWYGTYAGRNVDTFVRCDASFAPLSPGFDLNCLTPLVKGGVGRLGQPKRIAMTSTPGSLVGTPVVKVGLGSGLTYGHILAYSLECRSPAYDKGSLEYDRGEGHTVFSDFLILGDNGRPFDCEGDSGSLVVALPHPLGKLASSSSPAKEGHLEQERRSAEVAAAAPHSVAAAAPSTDFSLANRFLQQTSAAASTTTAAAAASTAHPIPSAAAPTTHPVPAAAASANTGSGEGTTALSGAAASLTFPLPPASPCLEKEESAVPGASGISTGVPIRNLPQPIGMLWGGLGSRGRLRVGRGNLAESWSSAIDVGRLLELLDLELVTQQEDIKQGSII